MDARRAGRDDGAEHSAGPDAATMSPGARLARFLIPSAIGIALFLTPVTWEGGQQIVVGVLAGSLQDLLGAAQAHVVNALFLASALGSALGTWVRPAWIVDRPLLRHVFVTTAPWLALRLLGGALSTLVAFDLGPEWIVGADTGQIAYVELAGLILCIMLVANFLLPLLTDFGFLHFVGTLLTRAFDRIFRLPGRAALDAVTSWVGDSSVGALLTIRQYETGHYTARQAAAVVTNFSAVSLPFSVVVAELAGLEGMFFTFYLTCVLCGVLCALLTPRLPPLSRIVEDHYTTPPESAPDDADRGLLGRALDRALDAAEHAPPAREMTGYAARTIFDIYFAVLPAAMTIQFVALVVVTYTDWLSWLSLPMLPLLWLTGIPDPWAVLPGTLIGFFDMFIPAIIAGDVADPVSRFVLAGLSITQLIFLAENGVLILRSSIPLDLRQIAAVFLLRTVISLPVLAGVAHLLF
jgi:nucleoside recognition membrane protein YjiH